MYQSHHVLKLSYTESDLTPNHYPNMFKYTRIKRQLMVKRKLCMQSSCQQRQLLSVVLDLCSCSTTSRYTSASCLVRDLSTVQCVI